jgi:hypothetical protein
MWRRRRAFYLFNRGTSIISEIKKIWKFVFKACHWASRNLSHEQAHLCWEAARWWQNCKGPQH